MTKIKSSRFIPYSRRSFVRTRFSSFPWGKRRLTFTKKENLNRENFLITSQAVFNNRFNNELYKMLYIYIQSAY